MHEVDLIRVFHVKKGQVTFLHPRNCVIHTRELPGHPGIDFDDSRITRYFTVEGPITIVRATCRIEYTNKFLGSESHVYHRGWTLADRRRKVGWIAYSVGNFDCLSGAIFAHGRVSRERWGTPAPIHHAKLRIPIPKSRAVALG